MITRQSLLSEGWQLEKLPEVEAEYQVFRVLGSDPEDGELFGTFQTARFVCGEWLPEVYGEPVFAWKPLDSIA